MAPFKQQAGSEGRVQPVRSRAGTNGLPREHVSEIQRSRIIAAMAEVAAERGAGAVTVAHVVARAGVSRRTFYDLFEDREECFLAAFEEAMMRAAATVVPAWRVDGSWRERVRSALTAILVFFDEDPALARLCVVEALAAGSSALEHRTRVIAKLTAAVDEGRGETRKGAEPPPLTADGVIGAVLSVIHARLLERHPAPLTGLLGSLMSMIVLPYHGRGAARRELAKPAPSSARTSMPRRQDPLEGLEMRITYRTVRVLIVIATNPGANNRRIATEAGIQDQGQVSKLLTRLLHLGLIENAGKGPQKGAPNAWRLTPKGQQVERAIRVQTTVD